MPDLHYKTYKRVFTCGIGPI